MSIFEFGLVYAICWWLVLFMVLPQGVQLSANPELGHAPSAPEKPRLGRKMGWTTVLAFIPAIALYFIANAALASDEIYHVGSGGCEPLAAHVPENVNAVDGQGANGKQVKPATLGGESDILGDSITMPVRIPAENYAGTAKGHNADLSQSFIGVGDVSVGKDGTVMLNGKPAAKQPTVPEHCKEKTIETK